MRRLSVREEYFQWLCNLVGEKSRSYNLLCRILHSKEFRWFIRNDDNRCEDGLNLRDIFVQDKDLDSSHLEVASLFDGACTILEVLVALCRRINEITYDLDTQENTTAKWFLTMLENLGLKDYDDGYNFGREFDPVTDTQIDEILEILMDRTYESDGRGGLFPLRRSVHRDQTKIEIWYQLMSYLEEMPK